MADDEDTPYGTIYSPGSDDPDTAPDMTPTDDTPPPPPRDNGKGGFNPDFLVVHDIGGEGNQYKGDNPEKPPYHAVVYPDGSVVYRNPSDPWGKQAGHSYLFNPRSIGIAYAGPVGSTPTQAGMDKLQDLTDDASEEYGIPSDHVLSHGEAYELTKGTKWQASKDGRGLDEASWVQNLRDPDAPLATPTATAAAPSGGTGLLAGLKSVFMPSNENPADGSSTNYPGYTPGAGPQKSKFGQFTDRLYSNPAFLSGMAMLGTQPGGSWGPAGAQAALGAGELNLKQNEQATDMQQRAIRQRAWSQIFPNGQPNPNHPLLKGMPPELVNAALAGGPEQGLPLLQKYALGSAEQKLQMQMLAQRAEMIDSIFDKETGAQKGAPPQGVPAPQPAVRPQGPLPPAQPPPAPQLPPAPQPPPQGPVDAAAAAAAEKTTTNPPTGGQSRAPEPQGEENGSLPTPTPGFVPPGMPGRVPPIASRNTAIGENALLDPSVKKALKIDLIVGDKTGRGASTILNTALQKAQGPELAAKTAYMTALGKAEGERRAANIKMQPALATMQHIEDVVRRADPKILNAATGPYMGDNQNQAIKSLFMPSKQATAVYNLNTTLHHDIDTIQKMLRQGSGTDQDQAIAGRAMGMFMRIKNDPQKMLEVINDAKNMIRAQGGEMPQYLVDKYKNAPAYDPGAKWTGADFNAQATARQQTTGRPTAYDSKGNMKEFDGKTWVDVPQ